MKWSKLLLSLLTAFGVAAHVRGQATQPVLSVSITDVSVLSGSGGVAFVNVSNPGSGYITAPTVTFSGGGGTGAAATAVITIGGQVSYIQVTNAGSGYTAPPSVTLTAPTGQNPIQATATAYSGTSFTQPAQNESYGPAGTSIAITALAVGTFPASGFTYTYYVNGVSIGTSAATPPAGVPDIIGWTPPQPGAYFLTVKATDGANSAVSLPVRYFAVGTAITSPTPNTIVPQQSAVVIQATATPQPLSGPKGGTGYTIAPTVTITGGGGSGATATAHISGGAVTSVTMTNYGTGYTSAPTVSFSGGGGAGATATSAVSNVVSALNLTSGGSGYTSAPVVTISGGGGTGANGFAQIAGGAVTTLNLTGSDTFVQRIDFYADDTLIGTDTTAPYSLIYSPANTPATHTVEARAFDNLGNQVSPNGAATIALSMVPPIGTPPQVSITTPANNATLAIPGTSAGPISVQVSAGSPTGLITKVELYIDGVLFGTATTFPYSFSWSPTVVGTYHLVALAYDDKSNVVASSVAPASTTVTIAASPTVALVSPTSATAIGVGSPVNLVAAAQDSNIGGSISKVQFFAGGVFLGESVTGTNNQYTFPWTPTTTGTVDLTAVAINALGLSTTSLPVTVNVASGGGGGGTGPIGTPPTVSVTYPTASTQLPVNQQVIVTANAADTDGNIVSVQFFANNQTLGTTTTYPYSATWTPTSLGNYTITAKATDNDGNTTTSTGVQVSVVDPNPGAPTVSVTAPSNGSTLTVGTPQTLQASASSTGAIASVQFFVNGQPQGGVITAFPYTTPWIPATPGTYTITARATNSSGVQATSAPSTVTVSAGTPPTVTLTSPANAATLAVNAPQTLTATASSSTATIASVQFYVNGVLVGSDTTFPYSTTWTPTSAGTFTILARATDGLGNITNSTGATVTVAAGNPPTVAVTNPAANSSYSVGTPLTLNATAADSDGTVAQVQFFVNGVAQGAASLTAPYNATWTPGGSGTYTITAQATDNTGNVTTSAPITVTITGNGAPTVSIITPKTNTTASAGTAVTLTASAADADGTVTRVRFLANGTVVGTPVTAVPFTTAWVPSAAGTYTVVAEATDNSGNVANSAPITLTVIANLPPTVSILSPGNNYGTSAGLPLVLTATANDADGTVAGVRFFVNGALVGTTLTAAPYSTAWTPPSAGTYTIVAEATDNIGNVTDSAPVTVNVAGNIAPTVSITAPGSGTTVRVGAATTIQATAKDSDGTVASVQIYVNGAALGAPITTFPYQATWTPNSEGVYRITATATDNANATGTAPTVTVLAVSALSAATDRVYTGPFNGIGDTGKFAVIVTGSTATFIGYSTVSPAKVYYFPDMTVDAAGGFSGTDAAGDTVSGSVNDTGMSATINGKTLLIGVVVNGSSAVPAGHYFGSLTGVPGSSIDAIVGSDGSITLDLTNGTAVDVAAGMLTSAGKTATPMTSAISGSKITAAIDPLTSFLTGTITGANAGSFTGALSTGAAFSDGSLRNLSTRGQVGTGANVLIAGFVVGGDTPKQVLIRAIGPSLTQFGITGALADPQLQLYKVSTLIGGNDNWENNADIVAASSKVGAFPLDPTSKDAALLVTLAPGTYTAQVNGVGNTTGVALVELYDVDGAAPFATQKVMNVSTRGNVGTGQSQLIAGFQITGNIAKKVLIRAVGPTLGAPPFNLPGTLADPMLRLTQNINGTDVVIRENNDWSVGNDPALVMDASAKVGAFALGTGSKDAAILITLPPGLYTAQATGANNGTGLALIEVYEVP